MKQKDIALFVVIGIVSAVVSVLLSNFIFTPSEQKKQQAEVVDKISADFTVPANDSAYFNKDSINPTKLIQIGNNPDEVPFKESGN